jgi:hypothetical protein
MMFEKLFLFAGLLFLVVLPLLFFLKSPEHDQDAPKAEGGAPHIEAHIEV